MKQSIFRTVLFTTLSILIFASCHTEELNQIKTDEEQSSFRSNGEEDNGDDGNVETFHKSPLFIFPTDAYTYVGVFEDGYVHLPSPACGWPNWGSFNLYWIEDLTNGPGNDYFYKIHNPSMLAGLPEYIGGVTIAGIAINPVQGGTAQGCEPPDIILSVTHGSDHWLLFAAMNGSPQSDYEITNAIDLSASFADPADFELGKIESDRGKLYGVFSDRDNGGPGTTNLFCEIDMVNGNCTQLFMFPGIRVSGLAIAGNNLTFMHLQGTNPNSYGRLYQYDLVNITMSWSDLNLSSNPLQFAFHQQGHLKNFFLTRMENSAVDFGLWVNHGMHSHDYGSGVSTFHHNSWSKMSGIPGGNFTYTGSVSAAGAVIMDAAR